jgi:branched-chain amino acid transport system substrate-binding protein
MNLPVQPSSRRPFRARLAVAVLAAGTLALSACGGSAGGSTDTAANDEPVRVLFVGGKSGPTAQIVSETTQGLEAGIADVNDNGGIDGRKLELEVLDTGGDQTRAVSELQRRLSSGEKPDLVIPGVSSVEALAMAPILARQQIVSINNAASPDLNKPEDYPYHFGYTPPGIRQQAGLPDALKELGAKSVVALVGNDAYGETMAQGVKTNLEGTGIDVEVQTFDLADLDLSIAYEKAVSSHPDAVFFEAIGDPAQRLVEARQVVGATDIPAIGGFGINSTNGGPSKWASEEANKNLYTQMFAATKYVAPEDRSDVQKTFFERMDDEGGVQNSVLTPMIFFDIVRIYAAAANEAGSTDAAQVAKALEGDMEYPDVTMWSDHHWSADDHFPTPKPEDLAFAPRGELVDGMFRAFDEN